MIIEGSSNIKTKTICAMLSIYMKNQLLIFAIVVDISTLYGNVYCSTATRAYTFAVAGARTI